MLDVQQISKSYRDRLVLRDVSLSIAQGQILALLGPNGAGKSTLLSIISGLRRPDTGTVRINGHDMSARTPEARRLLGVAPQDLGIYPLLTVRENLSYIAELAGLRRARASQRVREIAELMELEHLLDRRARFMSGGEKRRLHTALALVHRPRLLLLDEPTSGIDVESRKRLIKTVVGMAADGVAICYTTHYLSEVEALPATVSIIDDGRIVASGGVDDLIGSYAESTVEFEFEHEVTPPENLPGAAAIGRILRIPTVDTTRAIGEVMRWADRTAATVVSIEVLRPSLETVFLSLTGHRFESSEGDGRMSTRA